ncbi:cytochrome P450 [Streptomyces sp. p1417]|uniref:Cytochrome P450 n=1 Tax=Streptomyces typhae TaxID=2681492 RepID=A0A6L6WVC1_9ACTN|nr:cytochrome P450 [Streptomyces typhae]MVO86202.1 cytochrome P450 [Streptomyces typhae]
MNAITDLWNVHPRHTWLRGERPSEPVEFDKETGMWHVYGYPEAVTVLGDPATYSSDVARRFVPGSDQWDFDGNLTQLDPPEHKKLRALVSRAFTPKMVADLEPSIAKVTDELIDELESDEFDLVDALAYPLPMIVIADLLGTPREDRDLIKKWADDSLAERGQIKTTDEDGEQARSIASQSDDQRKMNDYLLEHVIDRRRNPKNDLLTRLVQAEVDGDRLTDNQVVNFTSLLFFAGHVTTTMLLGNTLLCLDAYPEQMARVRADRGLVPAAIEESLRCLSPLASAYRATDADVELGGTRIPKDQMVEVWLSAANRDPRRFPDPDTFDITRNPNPHLGFSQGVHFCLGAPLARLEGRVALNILLDRFTEVRVDHERTPRFLTSPDFTGVWTLPLRTRR